MTRPTESVIVTLNTLTWAQPADPSTGVGAVADLYEYLFGTSPYLWTIFFKIDGTTVQVTDALILAGTATTIPTVGNHGDLGLSLMQVGQTAPIPQTLGSWTGQLVPIPVAPSVQPLLGVVDFPAVWGVIAVLMSDSGNVPDSAIDAGHRALNQAVQTALDQLIGTIGIGHTTITQADIDNLTKGISDAVSSAVKSAMDWWDTLWAYLLGADGQIGQLVLHWNQDDFSAVSVTDVHETWSTAPIAGVWTTDASVCVTFTCPAYAIAHGVGSTSSELSASPPTSGVSGPSSQSHETSLAALRAFRDQGKLGAVPGLATWLDLVSPHAVEVVLLASKNETLREALSVLLAGVASPLEEPTKDLPEQMITAADLALKILTDAGSRPLSLKARRARFVLGT